MRSRRKFIALLGGAAIAWPVVARAQQSAVPVIGFLDATTAVETVYRVSAFRDGLKEAGFIDGHNVAIEFRWAENKLDRLPALAADLVHRKVAVIVGPITAMRMARAATSTIPIVCVSGGDPIKLDVVTNLSRPGGNITGVSFASAPLQPKRLGLLHELVPPPATIAWLRDPRGPGFEEEEKEVPPAARELGRELLVLNAQSAGEIDAAFATMVRSRAGALLIGADILRSVAFVSLCWPAVDEPLASIVIIGFLPAIGRPTPGLTPGLVVIFRAHAAGRPCLRHLGALLGLSLLRGHLTGASRNLGKGRTCAPATGRAARAGRGAAPVGAPTTATTSTAGKIGSPI